MTDNIETTEIAQEAPVQNTSAPEVQFNNNGVPFISTLDETLRTEASLRDFKDANGLAKSFVETKKLLGKKVSDMTPEEARIMYGKLGVPSDPTQYKFEQATLPEGVEDVLTDTYKQVAYDLGITQEQAAKLRDWYINQNNDQFKMLETTSAQEKQARQEALKREFGSAIQERVALADRAVDAFGGDEIMDVLEQYGLTDHPVIIKAFAKAGALIREDSHTTGEVKGGALTPSEAQEKIRKNLADPVFVKAWRDINHPRHNAVVEEMKVLTQAQKA